MFGERKFNVLFLCTGNSARSIMAEAVLTQSGKGRFHAFSAGSHPAGEVNPLTVKTLNNAHIPLPKDLRSKSWDEFAKPGAPKMDFVFTVCDSAAGETCPIWPGQPMTAHWGFEDPAAATGSESERLAVFYEVLRQIRRRIDIFVSLPIKSLDSMALQKKLDEIGEE